MLRFIISVVSTFLLVTTASIAQSAPSPKISPDIPAISTDLEVEVWQASERDISEVEQKVIRLVQQNPDSAYAHFLLSRLFLEKFSQTPDDLILLRQSSELAQQTAELDSSNDFGVIATCEVLDATGQSAKALELLKKVMGSGLEVTWRSYFMLGKLSSERDHYDKVLGLYKQALAFIDAKRDIVVPYVIAVLRSRYSDNQDQLEKTLMQWNQDFPHVMFLEALAGVMITKENYKGAEKIYQIILSKHPQRIYARINHSILKVNFLKKEKEGLKDLAKILNENHEEMTQEFYTLIHTNIAMALVGMKEDKKAKKHFIALYNDVDKGIALSAAHAIYDKHQRYEKLTELISYINQNESGSDLGYSLLGELYSQKLNAPDDAIEAYQNAILLDSSKSHYHNGLGLAYNKKKNYKLALGSFKEAVRVNPSDAVARYNEACMYSLLGQPQNAILSLQEALALSPGLIDVAQKDPDLDNIRSLQAFNKVIKDVQTLDSDIDDVLAH